MYLREFERTDNVEYTSWFSDPSMNKYMGPAWSSEELDQIFDEEPPSVFSALHRGELIGVVSLALPNNINSSFGVTGVAVKPQKQRQGYGAKMLDALQSYFNTPKGQEWIGFISINNSSAQHFIEKQGWKKGGVENEMYRYSFIQRS